MSLTVDQLEQWKLLDNEIRQTVNKFEKEFIEYFRDVVIDMLNVDIGTQVDFRYVTNNYIYYTRPNGLDIVIPIECITTEDWKAVLYNYVQEIANAKTWDRLSMSLNLGLIVLKSTF